MKNSIKFIYFDVGGVLLKWRGSLVALARHLDRPLEELYRVFRKYDDDFCRGTMSRDEIWAYYCRELNVKTGDDFDYLDFVTDKFETVDVAHKLVHQLSEIYPIGLLTNLQQGTYEMIEAKGHIPTLDYAAVIKSYEVGFIKPEEQIYQIARKKAGVPHRQILFIDDYADNVEAARRLGWSVHRFDEERPEKSIAAIRNVLGRDAKFSSA